MLMLYPNLHGAFPVSSWEGEENSGVFDALFIKGDTLSLWPFQDVIAYASPESEEDGVTWPLDFTSVIAWTGLVDWAAYPILTPPPPAYAQTSDTDAFVTTWNTTGIPYSSTLALNSVDFHIDVESGGQVTIDWGDDTSSTYNASGSVSHYYQNDEPAVLKSATVKIAGDLKRFYFHYGNPFTTYDSPELLLSIDQWGTTQWFDMKEMFRGATHMTYRATDTPDLSANPRVHDMFRDADAFDADLSNWDVSSMTSLRYMFHKASSFNGDISGWDVSKVRLMTYMFSEAASFNADISGWNVSSVTSMDHMFYDATSFNRDISDWNVSSVNRAPNMFLNALSFNQDISDWDVSSFTSPHDMNHMVDAPLLNYNFGPWFIALDDTLVGHGEILVTDISSRVGFDPGIDDYAITGTDADDFTITNGQLVLNSAADYYSKSSYQITITANTPTVNLISPNTESSISTTIRVLPPSQTDPIVTSITRYNPATPTTGSDTLQFKVLFNEAVTRVGLDDFELSSPDLVPVPAYTYTSAPSLFVPYDVNMTDTITVSDSDTVAYVSVSVNITHNYISDLKVELIAPDGTARVLHDRGIGPDANIVKTYTPDFGDVSISGTWQLRIHDHYDGDEGILNSWSLSLGDSSTSNIITAVTGSGSQYYVTVAPPQVGLYNLDVSDDNDIIDSSGNSLSSTVPTVDDQSYNFTAIADVTPPVLALVGPSTVSTGVGSTYTDPGATCTDDNDGDITSRIVASGSVDTSTAGPYTITFSCTDASDNPAIQVSRTVHVVDPAPTVTSITRHNPAAPTAGSGTLQFKVLFSEAVTRVGPDDFELSSPDLAPIPAYTYASAPSLFVPYDVNMTDAITVSDSDTVAYVSVTVDITHDYISDLKVELIAPDGTARVLHDRGGGSDDNIVETYTPDFGGVSISGIWQLRIHDNYNADSGTLNSWSLSLGDSSTSNIITAVTGSGSQYYVTVAPPQVGLYNLDVSAGNDIIDSSGGPLYSTTPTGDDQSYNVTAVADAIPPVLALVGSSTVSVNVGSTYTDSGATCTDDNDGDITSRIVASGSVDTGTAGPYTITFSCTDASDNPAIQVSRTVHVVDPAPTVTSITRHNPAAPTAGSGTLQFKVLFSEAVTQVGPDDFELSSPSLAPVPTYTYTSAPSLFVPYNINKTDTITISDSDTVTYVSVSVNITHNYISDLKVELIAPDGTARVLHDRGGGSDDNIVKTYTPDFGGVSINGNWQLRIHDNYDADSGTLNSWSLSLGDSSTSNIITAVTGSGSQYYVTVAPPQVGTYNLDVSAGNDIIDSLNNPLSDTVPTVDDQSYNVTDTSVVGSNSS